MPASASVVISFKISIFALSNTTELSSRKVLTTLWLALKLVSLHYQIQQQSDTRLNNLVVISFKISIFALSNTTKASNCIMMTLLWLALKLVSLHYQIQRAEQRCQKERVVISFKISIFALSNTTLKNLRKSFLLLWLALKLVSLHYQIQLLTKNRLKASGCD